MSRKVLLFQLLKQTRVLCEGMRGEWGSPHLFLRHPGQGWANIFAQEPVQEKGNDLGPCCFVAGFALFWNKIKNSSSFSGIFVSLIFWKSLFLSSCKVVFLNLKLLTILVVGSPLYLNEVKDKAHNAGAVTWIYHSWHLLCAPICLSLRVLPGQRLGPAVGHWPQ